MSTDQWRVIHKWVPPTRFARVSHLTRQDISDNGECGRLLNPLHLRYFLGAKKAPEWNHICGRAREKQHVMAVQIWFRVPCSGYQGLRDQAGGARGCNVLPLRVRTIHETSSFGRVMRCPLSLRRHSALAFFHVKARLSLYGFLGKFTQAHMVGINYVTIIT